MNPSVVVFLLVICGAVAVGFIAFRHGEARRQAIHKRFLDVWSHLESNPTDYDAQMRFLTFLATQIEPVTVFSAFMDLKRPLSPEEQLLAGNRALEILRSHPLDRGIQNRLIAFLRRGFQADGQGMYNGVLDILAQASGPEFKQFALEVARWHYGRRRENGVLTIYDEQAIQNDLLARCKSELKSADTGEARLSAVADNGPGMFRIVGVYKDDGADAEITLDAQSPANARVKAELQGIVVTEVQRIGSQEPLAEEWQTIEERPSTRKPASAQFLAEDGPDSLDAVSGGSGNPGRKDEALPKVWSHYVGVRRVLIGWALILVLLILACWPKSERTSSGEQAKGSPAKTVAPADEKVPASNDEANPNLLALDELLVVQRGYLRQLSGSEVTYEKAEELFLLVRGVSTLGLAGSPLAQAPLLAVPSVIPGRSGKVSIVVTLELSDVYHPYRKIAAVEMRSPTGDSWRATHVKVEDGKFFIRNSSNQWEEKNLGPVVLSPYRPTQAAPPKAPDRRTPFAKQVDSVDFDRRVRIWAEQFDRPESWVRRHVSPSDSAEEANMKLVRARLREEWGR
jgi:hypothetical protein